MATKAQQAAEKLKKKSGPNDHLHLPGRHIYAEDVAEFAERMVVPADDPDPSTFGLSSGFPNTKEGALVSVIDPKNPAEIRVYRGEQGDENLAFVLHVAEKTSESGYGQDWIRKQRCAMSGHEGELVLEPACHLNGTMRTQLFFPKNKADWVGIICSDCKKTVVYVLLAPKPEIKPNQMFCPRHGIQPRYGICKHIVEGAEPSDFAAPATATDPGQLLCGPCQKALEQNTWDMDKHLAVACEASLNEVLGGKLEEFLVNSAKK